MRQTSSLCLCSSTLWPRWNGGSNQNQRSGSAPSRCLPCACASTPGFSTTSAMRKRSSKNWPVNCAPTILRVSLLAPSQAITQSASMS